MNLDPRSGNVLNRSCVSQPAQEYEATEDEGVEERTQYHDGYLFPGEEQCALVVQEHSVGVNIKSI